MLVNCNEIPLNFQQGFSQAIVLENPGLPSGDYVTNGAAWQFQLPEQYDPMNAGGPECVNCSTSQSAYWRRAEGGHSLCHQCSYTRQSRVNKIPKNKAPVVSARQSPICCLAPESQFSIFNLQAASNRRSGVICANCKTSTTTLWRRNNQGEPVCNACGLYFKLHNVNRPQSMKKDGIQTRKRKPKYSMQPKPKPTTIGTGDYLMCCSFSIQCINFECVYAFFGANWLFS